MKNKKVLKISATILVVIGVVLISLSFLVSDKKEMNNKPTNDNVNVVPSTPSDEAPPISYESVLAMATSLYGGEGFAVAVKDDGDRFVIERKYESNGNIEIYFVDKATGSVYTEDAPAEG